MNALKNLDEAERLITENTISLLYLSRPDCGVCTAIRPKVEALLQKYPRIISGYVDLDQLPEAAGRFSVYTIPAILLFAEGKETVREARYISMDDLEAKIARPYEILFS